MMSHPRVIWESVDGGVYVEADEDGFYMEEGYVSLDEARAMCSSIMLVANYGEQGDENVTIVHYDIGLDEWRDATQTDWDIAHKRAADAHQRLIDIKIIALDEAMEFSARLQAILALLDGYEHRTPKWDREKREWYYGTTRSIGGEG